MTKVEKEKKKQAWGSTRKKIMYGNWLRSNTFNETYAWTLSFDGVKSTRMSDAASWPFVDNGTERGGKWHIKKKLGQRRPVGCPPNKAKWLTIPKMLGLIFIRCPFIFYYILRRSCFFTILLFLAKLILSPKISDFCRLTFIFSK